jgi:NTE family protein
MDAGNTARPRSLSPVHTIPTNREDEEPQDGIALCLSGGGYRAMLFHLGALWRLNDAGYLPRLKRVSSVSGGSITAAALGLAWRGLDFDKDGVARAFHARVVEPLRRLAGTTIDIPAAMRNLVQPGSAGGHIAAAYRQYLFGRRTLQDLPADDGPGAGPRFVINSTNLQTGSLWRFERPYMADWRVGTVENPCIELAVAVAASSAFPPLLSPFFLDVSKEQFVPGSGADRQFPPYTERLVLSDGGVYDNLGLETAWKLYKTILVSDGGGQMTSEPRPHADWLLQTVHVLQVIDSQVRSLRKRQVIGSYQLDPGNRDHRYGTYWGTFSHIADYPVPDPLPCPAQQTEELARTTTRLCKLDLLRQQRLINWGYAICDAALRSHVDPGLSAPGQFPYPEAGVGSRD